MNKHLLSNASVVCTKCIFVCYAAALFYWVADIGWRAALEAEPAEWADSFALQIRVEVREESRKIPRFLGGWCALNQDEEEGLGG